MKLVIVSGRSGSGKSVALRVLEDLGYYCVDNLPLSLIDTLLEQLKTSNDLVAISIDVRNMPEQDKLLDTVLEKLPDNIEISSFFLNSSDKVLLKRYSETRRLHPFPKTVSHCKMRLRRKANYSSLFPLWLTISSTLRTSIFMSSAIPFAKS